MISIQHFLITNGDVLHSFCNLIIVKNNICVCWAYGNVINIAVICDLWSVNRSIHSTASCCFSVLIWTCMAIVESGQGPTSPTCCWKILGKTFSTELHIILRRVHYHHSDNVPPVRVQIITESFLACGQLAQTKIWWDYFLFHFCCDVQGLMSALTL